MSGFEERVLEHLPVFPDVIPQSIWERLRIQGLVKQSLELTKEALISLAQQEIREITEDFHCAEGWVVPG